MEIDYSEEVKKLLKKDKSSHELRILLLSDIHIPTNNVTLLKQWHQEANNGLNYDYVFISGDISSLPNDNDEINVQLETEHEGCIQALFMNDLEGFAHDLLYIPGNHDPSTLFSKDRNKLPILSSNPDGNINRGIY